MIAKQIVYQCRNCESQNIGKNGHNTSGSQQYFCKDCGKRGVLEPNRGYTEAQKEQILSACAERSRLRGIQRTFGVIRSTLAAWLKKDESNPKLEDTLLPAEPEDILEADELWSFVYERWNKRWLWTVMCRRTRQIVAFVLGDRSEATYRKLWQQIPQAYLACQSYSDFWETYQLVFPLQTHECVGKGSGQTNHMERWYTTLRQSCARFVRKTLSFSKSETMHEIVTRLFIVWHNRSLIS